MDEIRAAVIGNPISHSQSPKLFKHLSEILNKPVHYEKFQLTVEQLGDFINQKLKSFVGVNVTLPHKVTSYQLAEELSEEAKTIGAINMIRFHEGKIIGYNTDVHGVIKTIEDFPFEGKRAWVIGAGGAARAVLYALGALKFAEVTVWNRDKEKAESLCNHFTSFFPKTQFRNVSKPESESFTLVVNASPVGLQGEAFSLPLPKNLEPNALFFDLIYEPATTPFLAVGRRLGVSYRNGMDMLIWQAVKSWEIWFGPIHKVDSVFHEVKKRMYQP